MRYRALVFDFDGTLVDSNAVKLQGYYHAFADQPACLAVLDDRVRAFRNFSRYEIIRDLTSRIPGLDPDRIETEAAARTGTYTRWVEENIILQAAASPAGPLLDAWRHLAPLYLCSLTPLEPLTRIIDRIGWRPYFTDIEGYPRDKTGVLLDITCRHQIDPNQILMVGDGDNDREAAQRAGTAFFRIGPLSDLAKLGEHLLS
jgi:phosphoglycolate phosphatase-like HAD superfamily hydrolase